MQLLFEELLKNPNDGIGNKLEKNVYYSTINSQNRKAISKISVITEENKEKIKGFRIYYDDFFKNDLFYNNEKDLYFVNLDERRTFLEDGYIDSDVPLFEDVKKILRMY